MLEAIRAEAVVVAPTTVTQPKTVAVAQVARARLRTRMEPVGDTVAGGTGVYGKGPSGASRRPNSTDWDAESSGGPGYPGSGGEKELFGAGGSGDPGWTGAENTKAGHGAVRIIWGNRFSYPDNADVEAE